nr:hypothetical protein CFP56_72782 [Quercus suber]
MSLLHHFTTSLRVTVKVPSYLAYSIALHGEIGMNHEVMIVHPVSFKPHFPRKPLASIPSASEAKCLSSPLLCHCCHRHRYHCWDSDNHQSILDHSRRDWTGRTPGPHFRPAHSPPFAPTMLC